MKIKIEDVEIERVKELKKNIEELLNIYTNNMEFSEDNLNEIKKVTDKINGIIPPHLDYSLLKIKMVNSAGTKFTIK